MQDSFTFKQMEIINGSLLGDCYINTPKYGNSAFVKNQCRNHKSYLEWTHKELEPFSSSLKDHINTCNNKQYLRSTLITHTHILFTELRHKWYSDDRIKIVPKDLILTPLTIAIWFFDDGSNHLDKRQAKFSTYCFTKSECEFLCEQLKFFNIISYVDVQNVIHVTADSYLNIVELVKPFMLWDCFNHKIKYRDSKIKFLSNEETNKIIHLYNENLSLTQISNEINRPIGTISRIVKKHTSATVAVNNTSGITGINWDSSRQKWAVRKRINGKTKHLGRFATKEEAIKCLDFHIN